MLLESEFVNIYGLPTESINNVYTAINDSFVTQVGDDVRKLSGLIKKGTEACQLRCPLEKNSNDLKPF